jgi:hypothetical protein
MRFTLLFFLALGMQQAAFPVSRAELYTWVGNQLFADEQLLNLSAGKLENVIATVYHHAKEAQVVPAQLLQGMHDAAVFRAEYHRQRLGNRRDWDLLKKYAAIGVGAMAIAAAAIAVIYQRWHAPTRSLLAQKWKEFNDAGYKRETLYYSLGDTTYIKHYVTGKEDGLVRGIEIMELERENAKVGGIEGTIALLSLLPWLCAFLDRKRIGEPEHEVRYEKLLLIKRVLGVELKRLAQKS